MVLMLWLMYYEATVAEREDPLNPDKERQLFERLSMDPEDLKNLEIIRRIMRYIVKKENAQTTTDQRTSENNSGSN